LSTNLSPGNLTSDEKKLFNYIATNNLRENDAITIIYVNYLNDGSYAKNCAGVAHIYKRAIQPKSTYAHHVVIAAKYDAKFVVPHEILHILLDATHWRGPVEWPTEEAMQQMLWYTPRESQPNINDKDVFLARKRITRHIRRTVPDQTSQTEKIHEHPFVHPFTK